ncbi:hypothetical protein CR513_23453, partial [Mucuna pruriens]
MEVLSNGTTYQNLKTLGKLLVSYNIPFLIFTLRTRCMLLGVGSIDRRPLIKKIYKDTREIKGDIQKNNAGTKWSKEAKFMGTNKVTSLLENGHVSGMTRNYVDHTQMYGQSTPKFAKTIKILSLTSSALGCECNWNIFQQLPKGSKEGPNSTSTSKGKEEVESIKIQTKDEGISKKNHMQSLLALSLSNQDSLKGLPPLFPFLLQPLHLYHDQILKDVTSHEPGKRNCAEELGQLVPYRENRPKIWHVYYGKRFKKNRRDELAREEGK